MNRRGQTLIESTLATVVILVLLVATVDFVQVVYLHQALAEHVRSTARWAAVRPVEIDRVRDRLLFGGDRNRTPVLGLQPSNIAVDHVDAGTDHERLRLAIVNYEFRLLTPGLAGSFRQAEVAFEIVPVEWRP
jgi:hypothetical protein